MGLRFWEVPQGESVSEQPPLFDPSAPILPYGGTTGGTGSDASVARANREARDGIATRRQHEVIDALMDSGRRGATWAELADRLGYHHGQVSAPLSVLHQAGVIQRLAERRGRSSVYVMPEYVDDRDTSEWRPNVSARLLVDVLQAIDDDLRVNRVLEARRRNATVLSDYQR